MEGDYAKEWRPRGLTGVLVRAIIPDGLDPRSATGRSKVGLLQGWVSIVLNIVLCLVKAILGVLFGSVALMADAVHSLSDVGSSLVVVLGFLWARKPRDSKHPFGHGRIEFVTALVMAVLLMVMAIEFAHFGISRIIEPRPTTAPWWGIAVVAGTLLLKQWLTIFARILARATGSQALKADYQHHLADVLSTVLVLLALVASRWGWESADGWGGLGVACFVLYTGVQTARDAISPLLGEAPDREEIARIKQAAKLEPAVRGVHDIILHKYGDTHLVSFHIEVDARKSALEVHDIAERVEALVGEVCACAAIVHVDPVDRAHPRYEEAERAMSGVVANDASVTEFHDLRVVGPAQRLNVSVDVVAALGTQEMTYPEIAERVRRAIRAAMPGTAMLDVTVETGYHEE